MTKLLTPRAPEHYEYSSRHVRQARIDVSNVMRGVLLCVRQTTGEKKEKRTSVCRGADRAEEWVGRGFPETDSSREFKRP